MYRIFTLLMLCLYLSSFSQEKKFKFGLELTPNYSIATVFIKEPLHDSINPLCTIQFLGFIYKRGANK
jgi:hypothetical protein